MAEIQDRVRERYDTGGPDEAVLVTAAVAWCASAAGVANGMGPRRALPVGPPRFAAEPEQATRAR